MLEKLFTHYPLVYWNNVYVVNEVEREALLNPKSPQALACSDWVKIRSGLYRGDVSQVVRVDNDEMYLVMVVPRIAPPPTPKPGKRPRSQRKRVPARRLKPNEAVLLFGKKVTLTESGYEYQGHPYCEDGLRALYLRHDVLEPYRPTMSEISPFIDGVMERIVVKSKDEDATYDFDEEELYKNRGILFDKLRIESLLEVRDKIEVTQGDMVGMFGRIVEILKNDTVRIVVDSEDGEIEIDKPVDEIRAAFRVGDSVTIKIGILAGRTGLVEVVGDKNLIVRELNTLREVRRNLQTKVYLLKDQKMTVWNQFVKKTTAKHHHPSGGGR